MPDQNSPLWPLLRLIVVSSVTLVAVSVGYQQGFVAKSDLPVALAIAGSLLGVDGLHFFSGRGKSLPKQTPGHKRKK